MSKTKKQKGFTLIELMVSVSIFSVVMVMAMGSIISVLDANRKSDAMRTIMDDMNYTLEGMSRTIRFGTNYTGSNSSLTVLSSDGVTTVRYFQDGTSIAKEVTPVSGITSKYRLTSDDVTIQKLSFWVVGSTPNDTLQPRVIIVVQGSAGHNTTQSSFNLQTTVSQRKLDYQ